MNKRINHQIISGALRSCTLGIRFLLFFYLASKLDLAQMGVFTLYWTGLQLSASLIPLDVYAQTTRKILNRNGKVAENLQNHFGFIFIAILILSPLAVIINIKYGSGLEGLLLLLFIFHLPIEVYATDLSRLLVPLGKPLLSNIINFIRSAIWVLPLFLFFEINIIDINPLNVVLFWFLGSFFSVCVGLFFSKTDGIGINKILFNINWIKSAVRASFIFLIASLMFRSILGVDKFLINNTFGVEVVAIYAVYASGLLGILALLESGVSAWHYPLLVKSIRSNLVSVAKFKFKVFFWQNLFVTLALFFALLIFFPLVVYYFLPKTYFDEISLFFILSVGVISYCLTMPFHYVLYGQNKDFKFLFIYGLALFFMFFWYFTYMTFFGISGAGIMFSGALLVISTFRIIFCIDFFLKKE